MLFNSLQFVVFFPIVTLLYFLLPSQARWALLLIASCVFYMAFIPKYILILFFLIFTDYIAGLLIEEAHGKKRKVLLVISLVVNIGTLFIFKYFNFLNANFAALAKFLDWNYSIQSLSLILPIGLSFHTFQSMSYTIEVYRGNQKAEKHLGIYALYVLFYPQLVAGPIERPQNLLHQLRAPHRFDLSRIKQGLMLMAVGFFKKMAIADNLSVIVNKIYDHPSGHSGGELIIATYFFSFQILCDFSGYTDIARGAAWVMGINLMENFKRPYLARSVAEFWKRWHISLSSWFKDYLYIPLGGSRGSKANTYFNIMVVFLVSGLWHGANWTFVAWGALNGLFLVVSIITVGPRAAVSSMFGLKRFPAIRNFIDILITFHLMTFAWIFFRARSIGDAFYVITHLFDGGDINFNGVTLTVLTGLIAALAVFQMYEERTPVLRRLSSKPLPLRLIVYYLFVVIFVAMTLPNIQQKPQKFIYFQF